MLLLDVLILGAAKEVILSGTAATQPEVRVERPCQPVFLAYPHGPQTSEFVPPGRMAISRSLEILGGTFEGTVHASSDAWTQSTRATSLVSQYGGAISGLDNAIYDRKSDWLLVFESDSVKLEKTGSGTFRVRAKGKRIKATLYEHYVSDHLGYFFWERQQPLWTKPVMGWCSWMAHLQGVNEEHMKNASKFFAQHLKAYGYNIIQMDDGFQRVPQNDRSGYKTSEQVADLWNKPNDKFPSGLNGLAAAIRADGMTPGIWVGLYLPVSPFIERYVNDEAGNPFRGPWVNYAVNGLDNEALSEGYLNTFKGLKSKGWRYIKVDTLRHVLYDSYRKNPEYWKARKESPELAFRRVLSEIKKVWGKDIYLLACWGTLPELAGIPDGCRIGEDVGPDMDSMQRTAKYVAQFHHLNNVVWRNDPDYMCFRIGPEGAKTWSTLLSLTGCQLMVSDPIETYDEARLDVLRRVGPTVFARPQNVAQMPPNPELAVFHGQKSGETWTVVGKFAFDQAASARQVLFSEIGLEQGMSYLAFDFWRSEFLGIYDSAIPFDPLARGTCQAIALRPLKGHPQVVGTDRHVLQGAMELSRVKWGGNALSGTMELGPERDWSLFIHVPSGYEPISQPGTEFRAPVLKVTFPRSDKATNWRVQFKRKS